MVASGSAGIVVGMAVSVFVCVKVGDGVAENFAVLAGVMVGLGVSVHLGGNCAAFASEVDLPCKIKYPALSVKTATVNNPTTRLCLRTFSFTDKFSLIKSFDEYSTR